MLRKQKINKKHRHKKAVLLYNFCLGIFLGLPVLFGYLYLTFENKYYNSVYPGIKIAGINFGGATKNTVTDYWLNKNLVFKDLEFTFKFESDVATISGVQLDLGFDATLSATQAYSIGRSGNFITDIYLKYQAATGNINLNPLFKWQESELDILLNNLSQKINIVPENALFEFKNGKATAFKLSKNGRELDIDQTKAVFKKQLETLSKQSLFITNFEIALPVNDKEPQIKTSDVNKFGITELVGSGESYFRGSIAGRIHNISLAADRINGILINPGEIFSFNSAVGDISAATGYKQAYVIKSGRTVLDDGGGVCQVSTTLFRAAINSGMEIVERHAHSYRVGYYEQGGWKPGFDATIYAPSFDLKFKNNTSNHLLIQTETDFDNSKLTFYIYGKSDGRQVYISPVKLWDQKPSPPDLYQDDPTLPIGTVKQVDWANGGVKASFDYKVSRGDEIVTNQTFFSNFIPWQAVFLRGTKQ